MTNAPIRIVVLLAAISLAGILATQSYWASRAISSQEKQFSHSVQMALRNVVESLCEQDGYDFPTNDPIEQVSSNYFIVHAKNKIDLSALEYLLKAELQERAIDRDFEYGVYDCGSERMIYGDFVKMGENVPIPNNRKLPKLSGYDTYFGVFFPGISSNPLWGMDLWKFTTGMTLLVIIFFGYALFVILRQKKLSTVQRDFVNNITHEFKTPIATLKIAAGVISETKTDHQSERITRYAEIIQDECERLEKHVDQLLNSAVADAKTEIELVIVDVGVTIQQMLKTFNLKNRDVDISFSCDQVVKIIADLYLFRTALYNLIDNAIKYGDGQVSISVTKENEQGLIEISNDGKPIPKSQVRHIFKKFYRISEGNQHNVKGFGLGLFVVKKAIQKTKGTIHVSLDPRTTFTIKLPLA